MIFVVSEFIGKFPTFNILSNKIALEQQMRFSGFTKINWLYQHKNAHFLVS